MPMPILLHEWSILCFDRTSLMSRERTGRMVKKIKEKRTPDARLQHRPFQRRARGEARGRSAIPVRRYDMSFIRRHPLMRCNAGGVCVGVGVVLSRRKLNLRLQELQPNRVLFALSTALASHPLHASHGDMARKDWLGGGRGQLLCIGTALLRVPSPCCCR